MIYAIILVFGLVLGITLYVNVHPVFGGRLGREDKQKFRAHSNYANGKFRNPSPVQMEMNLSTIGSFIRDAWKGGEERRPRQPLPLAEPDWARIRSGEPALTWFGHSTFLLSIEGKQLLVDPMFGRSASPVSFVGSKRYSGDLLAMTEALPAIDAVLITHDHYDHLDYPSIQRLRHKVRQFFVPLGVGAHLVRWGVERGRIRELNWWDELEWEGLTLAAVPARHFSGRGLANRDSTLWMGWVILSSGLRLYISGDGGYGPHFQEIGEAYGPFDFTFIEGGQYDTRWPNVHMMPEQSVQAHLDVKGDRMMLSHWGAFTLAYHSWIDPVERARREAERRGVTLLAPRLGETVPLRREAASIAAAWWREH
ncbi:MBL fold metallo-hydrolase [Xylanibacillus composti]|uniref:MBL fold metallo-hydrolase n=1 Tax=Xylanibacillus composti TaxID=1572762 RepID=A0A8J4M4M3_9BACL|nr:MBL fold metallo-hydrolase [Xylanibacillus composti]GIQ71345.1 MBL fold metallo-hydrolase [Xylanibacillus composti]